MIINKGSKNNFHKTDNIYHYLIFKVFVTRMIELKL